MRKTISFKQKFIPLIVSGVKTQTRRLKKEGEYLMTIGWEERGVFCQSGKPRFEIQDVCRVVDENANPVWYCSNCKKCYVFDNWQNGLTCLCRMRDKVRPLEVKILSIREQKLKSITNKEAEAEVGLGFKYPRKVFFKDFFECYPDCKEKNPVVWALKFEKVI